MGLILLTMVALSNGGYYPAPQVLMWPGARYEYNMPYWEPLPEIVILGKGKYRVYAITDRIFLEGPLVYELIPKWYKLEEGVKEGDIVRLENGIVKLWRD
jgi:hypothetical protein